MSEVQRPNNPGSAWCSQHAMHPDACFHLHRPDVAEVKGSPTPEEHAAAIAARHTYLQEHPEEVKKPDADQA